MNARALLETPKGQTMDKYPGKGTTDNLHRPWHGRLGQLFAPRSPGKAIEVSRLTSVTILLGLIAALVGQAIWLPGSAAT